MRPTRTITSLALATGLLASGSAATAESIGGPADSVSNFATDVVDGPALLTTDDTSIVRTEDGLTLTIRMRTPEPGSYHYPDGVNPAVGGGPEIFTGWAFIFNHPEHCVSFPEPPRCGPDDFTDEVLVSVYNFGGHLSSLAHERGELVRDAGTDGMIVLHGTIAVGEEVYPGVPPNAMTVPLVNPMGAEIHASIAPHGGLTETTDLEHELRSPQGAPGCDCIWLATFLPPDA